MITHNIPVNIKEKITLNYPKSAAIGFCSKGLKNEFETAMVNEPSVFEPLKFYCNSFWIFDAHWAMCGIPIHSFHILTGL